MWRGRNRHLDSSNTNVGVAKRAAGNKIAVWCSRLLRAVPTGLNSAAVANSTQSRGRSVIGSCDFVWPAVGTALRGVIAAVAGGGVLVRACHAEF